MQRAIPRDTGQVRGVRDLKGEGRMIHGSADDARIATRVLVVEDHADCPASTTRLLSLFGYDVRIAATGPRALEMAWSWRPDAILLDIGLPGMDGFEVARRLRKDEGCPTALLIAVTGHSRAEDRERSRAAGIDHHLLKPVNPDVLLSLLSSGPREPTRWGPRRVRGGVLESSGEKCHGASKVISSDRMIQ